MFQDKIDGQAGSLRIDLRMVRTLALQIPSRETAEKELRNGGGKEMAYYLRTSKGEKQQMLLGVQVWRRGLEWCA